jgi:branched-chain amino acid transport system permease protein
MAPFGIPLLEPTRFIIQTINGIQFGLVLFLIASGLTVILGILDVLNLAHGSLYALGAYIASSVVGFAVGEIMAGPQEFQLVGSFLFVGLLVVAALVAAAIMLPIGAIIEAVFIRPIYERAQVYQLVLTFALLLIVDDLIRFVWAEDPTSLDFSVNLAINEIPSFGIIADVTGMSRLGEIPTQVLMVMIISAVLAGLLFWFFAKTKTGRIIRATAIDREMAQALGVSPDRTFTLVFAFGAFLAGFAGSMQLIRTSARVDMGASALVLSFVVIVVGGLGSLRGAFFGALIVGILQNWMIVINPELQTAAPFVVMVLVLLVKPEGLFGTWGERT